MHCTPGIRCSPEASHDGDDDGGDYSYGHHEGDDEVIFNLRENLRC